MTSGEKMKESPLSISPFSSQFLSQKVLFAGGAAVLLLVASASARVINVSAGGDIISAVNEAVAGDVVELAAGSYTLSSVVVLDKDVTIRGAGRLRTTVVSDGGTHGLFELRSTDAVVSDMAIAGGKTQTYAAVYIVNGTLQDAIVRDCENRSYSGGIYIQNGQVSRCIVFGNYSSQGGGGIYTKGGAPVIDNTLAYGNTAQWGGGFYAESGSRPTVVNCTFAGNTARAATSGGPDTYDYSGSGCLTAVNTVLGALLKNGNAKNSVYTSCVDFATTSPGFVSAGGYNFRPAAGSPLLGTGTSVSYSLDVSGNPFPATPSIGAYQPQPAVGGAFAVISGVSPAAFKGETAAVTVHFPASLSAASGMLTVFDPFGDSTAYPVTDGATVAVDVPDSGVYSLLLAVTDGATAAEAEMFNAFVGGVGNVYVDAAAANPIAPYDTPATAAQTIADAIPEVLDGGTVWICDGTYTVSSVITVDRPVTIKSVNGNSAVIFQGGANRLFSLDNPGAKLSGFTMQGPAQAVNMTGLAVHFAAGGGAVEDCVIENFVSAVGDGGAVFAEKGPGVLERCILRNNSGGKYGGAVYVARTARLDIANCLFYGNSAAGNWGSAVYNDGPGSMVNCTLYNNPVTPAANGQFCRNYANFGVTNCILGSVSWYVGGTTARANNLGDASTLADPGFADLSGNDFHLGAAAVAAIDQGEDAAVPAGATDLTGVARIQGEHVDIGCYEFSVGAFSAGFTIEGAATNIGDKVSFVPSVTGATDFVNHWRLINLAGGPDIEGATTGTGTNGAFEVTFQTPGVYSVFYSVTGGPEPFSTMQAGAVVIRTAGDVYVAPHGTPVAPYSTPSTATTNLAAAARIVASGARVIVAPGDYEVYERVKIGRGASLVGAGKDVTRVTSEAGARHGVFAITDRASQISGVQISGTFSTSYSDGVGGGVRIDAGLLVDCRVCDIVMDSPSVDGTAVAAIGDASHVSRVEISNCVGGRYGTLYLSKAATVDNCLVYDSHVNVDPAWNSAYGGLLYIDQDWSVASASLTNCTFVGTQVRSVYSYTRNFKYVNCVFDCPVENMKEYIATNTYFNCASTYPILEGNLVENGNLSELESIGFADKEAYDFRPSIHSPIRGAGLFVPWMRGAVDFYGRKRTSGDSVDIGCAQYPGRRETIIEIQ